MTRRNANTEPKPKLKLRKIGGKPEPKRKPTDKRGGKRPATPADEDGAVTRSSRVRSTSRGGRGR